LALPFGFMAMVLHLFYRRRHGDSDRLEDFTTNALALAPDRKALAVFFDRHLLQCFEILLNKKLQNT